MKKLATIIAIALLATLVVAATWWMKIRDGRAQVEQLQARVTALEAAPKPAPAVVEIPPVLVPAPATKPVASAAAKPAPAAAVAAPSAPKLTDSTVAAQAKQLMSTDAGRGMIRAVLQQQYPDLARELGISDAQAGNLLDVLVRQQMDVSVDALGMLGGTATPAAQQEMQRKVEEKTRANETELKSLLGNKYDDFQQYQANTAARQQITQLQNALGAANALSDEQSKALLKSLAAVAGRTQAQQRTQPTMQGGTPQELLANQLKQSEENSQQLLQAASPHLNITQQEIYKNLLQQQITMVKTIMQSMSTPAPTGAR